MSQSLAGTKMSLSPKTYKKFLQDHKCRACGERTKDLDACDECGAMPYPKD